MKILKDYMLVFLVMLALITSGCNTNMSEKNNNITPAANHQAPKPLDANDLNITYNGILINDGIPFSKITDKLGYGIGYQENNYGLISQNNGVRRFALIYSSGEGLDIRLVFVESKDIIFAFADLIKIPTSRGIKVGDSIDKLYEMYGESDISASGEVIYEIGEKRLIFEIDKGNGIIKKITIDYNMKLADKEQGL